MPIGILVSKELDEQVVECHGVFLIGCHRIFLMYLLARNEIVAAYLQTGACGIKILPLKLYLIINGVSQCGIEDNIEISTFALDNLQCGFGCRELFLIEFHLNHLAVESIDSLVYLLLIEVL